MKDLATATSPLARAYREMLRQKPDFLEQVTNYCMLGAEPDYGLPTLFDVPHSTWLYWLKHSEDLRQAIYQGTHQADVEVVKGMHRRATGYEYTRQKVVVNKQGEGTVHNLVEHVPPDTNAGKFWLTNRQPQHWRDRQSLDHTGQVAVDTEITVKFVSPSAPPHQIAHEVVDAANDQL